jgi:hypothetical protein
VASGSEENFPSTVLRTASALSSYSFFVAIILSS